LLFIISQFDILLFYLTSRIHPAYDTHKYTSAILILQPGNGIFFNFSCSIPKNIQKQKHLPMSDIQTPTGVLQFSYRRIFQCSGGT